MKQLYILLCCALSVLFINSCRKEDNTFKGTDNIIASFQLKKGDLVLKAAITPDSIRVIAPGNISLTGAVATLVLSERASITPDPAGIEDWGISHEFTVTSYSGAKRTYRYYVERNVIAADGDIVLVRQADVDSLAALGISRINGDLNIGQKEGTDSIYSLAALSAITDITGNLVINPTFAGTNLQGLENLVSVGSLLCGPAFGNYTVGPLTLMDMLSLPKLSTVRTDLILNGGGFKVLNLPSLKTVDGALQILNLDSIAQLKLPLLEQALGSLLVLGSGNQDQLTEIELPAFKKAGEIRIAQLPNLTSIKLVALKDAQSFVVTNHPKLTTITAQAITNIYGNTDFSNNELLTNIHASALTKIAGNFTIENAFALETLDGLLELETVGGQLRLNNLYALSNWNGLKKLEAVGGNCQLMNIPVLNDPDMEGLQSLSSIGGDVMIYGVAFKNFTGLKLTQVKSLSIYGSEATTIESIDLSGLDVLEKIVVGNMPTQVKLKGKDVYNTPLYIEGAAITMEGFKEVKDLTFTYYLEEAPVSVQELSVEKVKGNLTIAALGFTSLRLPNLTVVEGKSQIDSYGSLSLELPSLTTAGEMTLSIGGSGVDVFGMPELQTVKGNLVIATGLYSGSVGYLQFPKLKTVEGKLQLLGANEYYGNTRMTNLNGFKTLTSVQGIDVHYNLELKDYSGLKSAIASFAAEQWSAIGNAYNPSYEDLQNGEYVQP